MGDDNRSMAYAQEDELVAARARWLGVVTYGTAFMIGLDAVLVCWNVFLDNAGWHGNGVLGLILAPLVPAVTVGAVYYAKAAWHLVPDTREGEQD